MIARPLSLLIFFLLVSAGSLAQNDTGYNSWYHVDTSIRYNRKIEDIKKLVLGWQERAIREKDYVTYARSIYNLIRIADRQTEDSLFFKNSLILDNILSDNNTEPFLRAIVHVLKAKRIAEYKSEFFFKNNKGLVSSYDPRIDYGSLTAPELDGLINSHFVKALNITGALLPVSARGLMWLTSDQSSFQFEPRFVDIIYAERINVLYSYIPVRIDKNAAVWLRLSPDEFVTIPLFDDRTDKEKEIFRYYKDWMQHHRDNPKVYYYLESLARKFFYNNLSPDSAQEKLYEAYLVQLTRSPWSTVKAHGIYQLCLRWNSDADNYNPLKHLYNFRHDQFTDPFRIEFRQHYVKALKLYNENEQLLDSFPVFKSVLSAMKANILKPGLQIALQEAHVPGKPIMSMVGFRNVQNLHTRLVKWRTGEYFGLKEKKETLKRFTETPAIYEKVQPLQLPEDYQWHNAIVKIDPLPAGRYFLLYSDSAITCGNRHLEYVEIIVSRIAMVNNNKQVFVLDRETGFPLFDARLMIDGEPPFKKINKQGYITVKNEDVSDVTACLDGDTLVYDLFLDEREIPDEVFDKEDEDLGEYYEEHTSVHIYTDRAIYRPGQTVHYKGIFVTRNPRTGEPVLFNWKNIKAPFFTKLIQRIAMKFSREKIELYINDPFEREQDTINTWPDKYGSFSGSFKLPADAATGTWEFDCLDFELDYASGSFQVEEYKRPTFELLLEKPKQELQLGDSFTVKAIVRSFAGAQLNNVLVKYSVEVYSYLSLAPGESRQRNDTLVSHEAYTNDKGELVIQIRDTALSAYNLNETGKWQAKYSIEAQAIDATGESHEETLSFDLSTQPVNIQASIPLMMERNSMPSVYIATTSEFAGELQKQVHVKIYKTVTDQFKSERSTWPSTDVFLYDSAEFKKWFPYLEIVTEEKEKEELVFEDSLLSGGDEKLVLPASVLKAGKYRIELVVLEDGMVIGEKTSRFSIFDSAAIELPGRTTQFIHQPYNVVDKGQKVTLLTGNSESDIFSIYHLTWFEKTRRIPVVKNLYFSRAEKKGINQFEFTVPSGAVDQVLLSHVYVVNNESFRTEKRIYISDNSIKPEIIVEKFRSRMVPGGKETFSVSIKTNNENTAAQLMTTMYDATLDKLEEHTWPIPEMDLNFGIKNQWEYIISSYVNSQIQTFTSRKQSKLDFNLWWINPGDYGYRLPRGRSDAEDVMADYTTQGEMYLQGRVAGLSVINTKGLSDVVVVGYGTVKKLSMAQSIIHVRGLSSLNAYNNVMVVLDGVVYEKDISTIDVKSIYQAVILKGADATAIYGSRAASGVIVISTKGPVVLPQAPQPPPPVIRKNFSETAFFYPSLTADRNGYYNIQFTLPQSVTTWKWKMLAHTKNAVFTYVDRTLQSQLPLMVQPDMPRFLYQGDKIVLKTRISNLDSMDINGSLNCVIEDMVTGEDITSRLLATNQRNFSVYRSSNTTGAFEISIPGNLLNPLRVKISAQSSSFSDGEEHVIPVLSKKILVSYSAPIAFSDKNEVNIPTPALPSDAEPLGVSLYITPQQQAAMINGLSWLAKYPWNCAEQTFNKMLAQAMAVKIMQTDTAIQRVANTNMQPGKSIPTQTIPAELSEETMPWLQLNNQHAVQQQRLAKLLDSVESKDRVEKYFAELRGLQTEDGGLSWFNGGKSDPYISNYIVAGLGKMENEKIPMVTSKELNGNYDKFIKRLIAYCDKWFWENLNGSSRSQNIHYIYGRSFWLQQSPLRVEEKTKIDSLLNNYWQQQQPVNFGRQSLLVIITMRMMPKGHSLYIKAIDHLESLRQSAIRDNINGIRWKPVADEDDLSTRFEEWIVKAAEAFEADPDDRETIPGIITWLLRNRNEHNWSSTKATADVVSLLRRRQKTINKPLQLQAKIDSEILKVSNDLLNGVLHQYTKVKGKSFPAIPVSAPETAGNSGSINYYYFTQNPVSADIKMVKTIFRFNNSNWEAITPATVLKPGDKIKTTLTITTPRMLQYVFIDEKRAAACEPTDGKSGYEYDNNFSYYKSVRDIGFQFFAEKMPSGVSVITYESVVAKTGSFAWGAAELQCMYRPDIRAWSNSLAIEVKE